MNRQQEGLIAVPESAESLFRVEVVVFTPPAVDVLVCWCVCVCCVLADGYAGGREGRCSLDLAAGGAKGQGEGRRVYCSSDHRF